LLTIPGEEIHKMPESSQLSDISVARYLSFRANFSAGKIGPLSSTPKFFESVMDQTSVKEF